MGEREGRRAAVFQLSGLTLNNNSIRRAGTMDSDAQRDINEANGDISSGHENKLTSY